MVLVFCNNKKIYEMPIVENLQVKVYELVAKVVKDHRGLAVTT